MYYNARKSLIILPWENTYLGGSTKTNKLKLESYNLVMICQAFRAIIRLVNESGFTPHLATDI